MSDQPGEDEKAQASDKPVSGGIKRTAAQVGEDEAVGSQHVEPKDKKKPKSQIDTVADMESTRPGAEGGLQSERADVDDTIQQKRGDLDHDVSLPSVSGVAFRFRPVNFSDEDCSRAVKDRRSISPIPIDRAISTFEDLVGLDDLISSVKEAIYLPVIAAEFFNEMRLEPATGILFHGRSGCGKTAVAQSIRNLCNGVGGTRVAFFAPKLMDICKSDENALAVLFKEAKILAPSVVLLDQVEQLTSRTSPNAELISRSLMSEMSGVESRGLVWIVGCTREIDKIDSAFREPGRFDHEFELMIPDEELRMKLLQKVAGFWSGVTTDMLQLVVERTGGWTLGEVKAVCYQAALQCLKRTNPKLYNFNQADQSDIIPIVVQATDFDYALDHISHLVEC